MMASTYWLDGHIVINAWSDGPKDISNTFQNVGAGMHLVAVEFYETRATHPFRSVGAAKVAVAVARAVVAVAMPGAPRRIGRQRFSDADISGAFHMGSLALHHQANTHD